MTTNTQKHTVIVTTIFSV